MHDNATNCLLVAVIHLDFPVRMPRSCSVHWLGWVSYGILVFACFKIEDQLRIRFSQTYACGKSDKDKQKLWMIAWYRFERALGSPVWRLRIIHMILLSSTERHCSEVRARSLQYPEPLPSCSIWSELFSETWRTRILAHAYGSIVTSRISLERFWQDFLPGHHGEWTGLSIGSFESHNRLRRLSTV